MKARRGLHGTLVEDLGRRIVHGAIPPGSTIVPNELGATYGVSRTVVREALRVLESKGLVSARQNVGTKTLPPSDWDMLDGDVVTWRLIGADAETASTHLLELRSAIEPLAARLSAERADDDARRSMQECAERMVRAARANDHAATLQADLDLHAAIFRAAENPMLARLEAVVNAALEARRAQVRVSGFSATSLSRHQDLVASIVAGRAQDASAIMEAIVTEAVAPIE